MELPTDSLNAGELDCLGRALDERDAQWPEAVAAIRLLALPGEWSLSADEHLVEVADRVGSLIAKTMIASINYQQSLVT